MNIPGAGERPPEVAPVQPPPQEILIANKRGEKVGSIQKEKPPEVEKKEQFKALTPVERKEKQEELSGELPDYMKYSGSLAESKAVYEKKLRNDLEGKKLTDEEREKEEQNIVLDLLEMDQKFKQMGFNTISILIACARHFQKDNRFNKKSFA